jgi:hypothetical protein
VGSSSEAQQQPTQKLKNIATMYMPASHTHRSKQVPFQCWQQQRQRLIQLPGADACSHMRLQQRSSGEAQHMCSVALVGQHSTQHTAAQNSAQNSSR